MKFTTLFSALAVAAFASAQSIDPAEPILPTIIKPSFTRTLTLVTITPRPTLITKSCGPCPISTTSTVTLIYKRPPICPLYLCAPCPLLEAKKREVEERQALPTTTVLAPCCCAIQKPTTTTITKDPCPNPCACVITTTVVPTCTKPIITLY